MKDRPAPIFKALKLWVEEYGRAGIPDQRAVEDFLECETHEAIRGLQSELQAVQSGYYVEDTMNLLVGTNRVVRHGTYEEWAGMMLKWIASYRK